MHTRDAGLHPPVVVCAALLIAASLLAPAAAGAATQSRLLPRFDKDSGIQRLAQVTRLASRRDIVSMGSHRQLLLDAGIRDADLGDNRVVAARVYCCNGPNEESESIWAYVPPAIQVSVGDVIEVRMGDEVATGRPAAVNMVLRVRAARDEVPGKCHWDPPDESKWARILYCEGIEQEGWVERGGIYRMWLKPRDASAPDPVIAVLAAAPPPAAAPIPAPAELSAGAAAFAAGDIPRALELWDMLADDGQPTALALAALLHTTGAGVPRNVARAATLFERLEEHSDQLDFDFALSVWQARADAGDPVAEFAVGWLRLARGADAADGEAGAQWLRRSADHGSGLAAWALGQCHQKGPCVPKDARESARWFQVGAERGSPEAAFALGVAYEHGNGVKRSAAEAARWYRVAAEGGLAEAALNLGNMLSAGQGLKRDRAEGVSWYRKAAALGSSSAANNLGVAYATGRGVPEDITLAYQWFSAAMARPYRLENIEQGGANLRQAGSMVPSAQRWRAKLALARMCSAGRELPRDDAQSWFWYELATQGAGFQATVRNTPEGQAVAGEQAAVAARLRPGSLERAQAQVRAWPYP